MLLLSAVEELGTAELAGVLGKSESAVRALRVLWSRRLWNRLWKNRCRKGLYAWDRGQALRRKRVRRYARSPERTLWAA